MKMLEKAIRIAVNAHSGQFDKGGNPYILHPLWVMNNVRHLGEDAMIVGILHDVVEDTSVTLKDLAGIGFNESIIDALRLLDFRGVNYEQRIKEIATDNGLARHIKMSDIEHNSKVTRLKSLRKKDFDRLEKYCRVYTYLKD